MVATIDRKWRANFIFFLIFLGFLGLAYRLVSLTVLQQKFLKHQGDIRSLRVVPIASSRGVIADRHNTPLAVSLPVSSLWINPKQTHWTTRESARLAHALGIDLVSLRKKISNKNKGFVYIKRKLSPTELADVQALHLPGIHAYQEFRRFYPMAQESAQFIGITNAKDQGHEGLELAYDAWLRGRSGRELVEKDRMGHVISVKKVLEKPLIGKSLQLSLDARIQSIAYEALKSGVKKYGAASGSVIVMAPKSGEVLAMANYPSFNPNNLSVVKFANVRNRATTDLFEPGSTIKTFSMINALSSGKYQVDSVVDTGKKGELKIHDNWVRDEFLHHGKLTLTDVLKKSSNVGIAKLTLSLPKSSLPHLLENLGFSRYLTGYPGEVAGRISQRYDVDPFELATLSFGYGLTTNHLQLAHAYSVLANYGVDPGVHFTHTKHIAPGKRIFSEAVAKNVIHMLESVLKRSGTGYRARIKGVKVAGKTGTAHVAVNGHYAESVYVSSFVGMLPADKPQYVVSVVLNQPAHKYYFGGLSAAPIFSEVGQKMVRLHLTDSNELVSLPTNVR